MSEQNNIIGDIQATGDIQAAINAGKALAIQPIEIGGSPILVTPEGYEVNELDHLRESPTAIQQQTEHTTAESFIDYFNEFSEAHSVIFVDDEKHTFNAILDYHDATPRWCLHTANFQLKNTPEWDNWRGNNKKSMTQEDFGRFIEENLEEIIKPSGAEMLEIALSIQAKTETKFSKAVRLDNGQLQLTYHEEINGTAGATGHMKIPETFTIGLKLYEGSEPYQMEARLRYRIKEGNLYLWYELIRPHKTIQANIADTLQKITEEIKQGRIFTGRTK